MGVVPVNFYFCRKRLIVIDEQTLFIFCEKLERRHLILVELTIFLKLSVIKNIDEVMLADVI